jgi:fumarylacetoacetate (FAA) hydrolase
VNGHFVLADVGVAAVKLVTFVLNGSSEHLVGVWNDNEVARLNCRNLIEWLTLGADVDLLESYPLDSITLVSPVPRPPSIRDFFAFEQHVATSRAKRGAVVPDFWYREPVFYFTNPAAVIGPGDVVIYPHGTRKLDYELEVAAVIGADEAIAGFTILNDWSARDIQREEITVGLGPAKGKDFATSIGPSLVTVDEFDGSRGAMTARINGIERSRGELADMHFTWEQIRERAARNTTLYPGDILGSGTVGSGCILESVDEEWLEPGDVVELEVSGLGILRNRVGPRPE